MYSQDTVKRFLSKVKISSSHSCWEWKGGKGHFGYGVFHVSYPKRILKRAHRVSWEIYNGRIPKNNHVCHKCDNPGCVNPDHLFVGSHDENHRDKVLKKRSPIGVRNGRTYLSEDDVKTIRQLCSDGWFQQEIANLYGLTQGAIAHIKNRRSWKHI